MWVYSVLLTKSYASTNDGLHIPHTAKRVIFAKITRLAFYQFPQELSLFSTVKCFMHANDLYDMGEGRGEGDRLPWNHY